MFAYYIADCLTHLALQHPSRAQTIWRHTLSPAGIDLSKTRFVEWRCGPTPTLGEGRVSSHTCLRITSSSSCRTASSPLATRNSAYSSRNVWADFHLPSARMVRIGTFAWIIAMHQLRRRSWNLTWCRPAHSSAASKTALGLEPLRGAPSPLQNTRPLAGSGHASRRACSRVERVSGIGTVALLEADFTS